MALVTTPAVLLRSFPYSETSRILRFFTPGHGVVGVMARGARKGGGKGTAPLESFAGGVLTLHLKQTSDLHNMKEFNPSRPRSGLGRHLLRFGGASLLAELVLRHAGEESNPPLFEGLEEGLDRLDAAPEEALPGVVLSRGWGVVGVLGYEPVLDACVEGGEPFGDDEIGRFDFAAGGLRCASCATGLSGPRVGPRARDQLRALVRGEEVTPLERPRANLQLLGDFVTYHVSGDRPLESFRFLAAVVPDDPCPG